MGAWPSSVVLAAAATGAAIALLATSGYLISRAAQRPQMISLMVAIVAVRAFGIARAVLRYGERLASHDLALRQLARLRLHFYRALAPLVPGADRRPQPRRPAVPLRRRRRHAAGSATCARSSRPLVAVLVILGASIAAWLMLPAAGAVVVACSAAGR